MFSVELGPLTSANKREKFMNRRNKNACDVSCNISFEKKQLRRNWPSIFAKFLSKTFLREIDAQISLFSSRRLCEAMRQEALQMFM